MYDSFLYNIESKLLLAELGQPAIVDMYELLVSPHECYTVQIIKNENSYSFRVYCSIENIILKAKNHSTSLEYMYEIKLPATVNDWECFSHAVPIPARILDEKLSKTVMERYDNEKNSEFYFTVNI